MRIALRKFKQAVVLDISGKITLGEIMVLRETIRRALEDGEKNIVLNLTDVIYIDSSGLGELWSSHITAINQQAKIILMNPPVKIRELLCTTKLSIHFRILDSEQHMMAEFGH
jgi:anti-sigma B factor antagonist